MDITEPSIHNLPHKSEQIRMLISLTQLGLDKICEEVTVEQVRTAVEEIDYFERNPSKIYKLHSALVKTFKDDVMSQFQEMLEEDEFDNKFCNLNDIINQSKVNNEIMSEWHPTGNASEDMRSQIITVKLKIKSDLEMLLREKEESVNKLKSKVTALREKAKEIDAEVLAGFKTFSNENVKLKKEILSEH